MNRLGPDALKHDSGESDDDYNDADWSMYPDKKSKCTSVYVWVVTQFPKCPKFTESCFLIYIMTLC